MSAASTLRAPATVSGVLDRGFGLYAATVFPNLALSAAIVLAAQAPNIYRLEHGGRDGRWWLLAIAGGLLSVFLWTTLLRRQQAALRQETLPLGNALAEAIRHTPAMAALAVLSLLAVALGLVLLVLPGLIAALIALLAPVALLADRLPPLAAWRRAWALLKPRLGLAAAVLSMTMAVFLVFFIVFAVLGVLLAQNAAGSALAERGGASYGGYLAQAVFAPLLSAVILTLYASLSGER